MCFSSKSYDKQVFFPATVTECILLYTVNCVVLLSLKLLKSWSWTVTFLIQMCHFFSAYNRQWKEAQTALDDLLKQELPPEPPKPEKDRQAAAQLLATMYIKYIQVSI